MPSRTPSLSHTRAMQPSTAHEHARAVLCILPAVCCIATQRHAKSRVSPPASKPSLPDHAQGRLADAGYRALSELLRRLPDGESHETKSLSGTGRAFFMSRTQPRCPVHRVQP